MGAWASRTGEHDQDGQIRQDRVDVDAVNAHAATAGRGYSLSSRRYLVLYVDGFRV